MLRFVTAADVTPSEFSDWYIFNTWLQRKTSQRINLHIPITFQELQQRIEADNADMVYANPYDAAMMVRNHGFVPLARPDNLSDEIVIISKKDSPLQTFTDISSGCRIALTDDRDVRMIGLILIEPADCNEENVNFIPKKNSVAVVKSVISGEADIGFILTKSYDAFSGLVTRQLRELIRSEISVINHSLMVKPIVLEKIPNLVNILTSMHHTANGKPILDKFGINEWLPVEQEETEFMIDLMETLK
ncbi:MAG: phosphate/phosphite/phosphonate ABC transporter substrate-binding protein [Paracoccus sp. (in: a-proteobacteria)]